MTTKTWVRNFQVKEINQLTFKKALTCISLHGISTIFAVRRMDWAEAVRQLTSSADNLWDLSSTKTNSTMTSVFFVSAGVFLLYNGKTRDAAQPRAKADFTSQTIWNKRKYLMWVLGVVSRHK